MFISGGLIEKVVNKPHSYAHDELINLRNLNRCYIPDEANPIL